MVSLRLTGFMLMILLLHIRDSSAQTKALAKVLATDVSGLPTAGRSPMNVEEEIDGGIPATAGVRKRLGGWKAATKDAMGTGKEEGLKGDDSKTAGAAHSVKKLTQRGKGRLNVSRKLHPSGSRAMDLKVAGFVALNADYHVPKPHPPKNN